MLIRFVKFLYRIEGNVRNLQLSLIIYFIRKKFVEWLLEFVFSFYLEFLFRNVILNGRDNWLLYLFVEVLHPLFDQLLVRSETKYDHETVEVLNPQIFARFLLAPVLEQVFEHFHVLFMNLIVR